MHFTLKEPFTTAEDIKKSRFITHAYPISSAEDASEIICKISDPNATHNCWAWKFGGQYRFNDDGEPTSTAGKPILSAIEHQNCNDVLILVIRYYGGIKLGTGGLIRAYGGCANNCLKQADLVEVINKVSCRISCFYQEFAIIENKLNLVNANIQEQNFNDKGVEIDFFIEQRFIEELNALVSNLTRGRESVKVLDTKI